MLITALNKTILGLALLLAVPHMAQAHGDGGIDAEESAHLYASVMQAMNEANQETVRVVTELEAKYAAPRIPTSDKAVVSFLEERIDLSAPAFSKLLDRSLDIFRARLAKECPACYYEKRHIESQSFRASVGSAMKHYLVHYLSFFRETLSSRRAFATASVGVAAEGLRLFAIHGLMYVVYTAITEGIESVFMGPFHWACPLFQWLYVPLAFAGHQLWTPAISRGWGLSLTERLKVSLRSSYLLAKYRIEMRRLYVAAAMSSKESVIKRSEYRANVAGIEHHIEEELNFKKFWSEIYRNFHARPSRPQNLSDAQMMLDQDFAKIFGTEISEAERFYIAVKHADGLGFIYNLLLSLTNSAQKSGAYSTANALRVSYSLLGDAGKHIERYRNLVIAGALSSRRDPAVQAHQRALAAKALQSITAFFQAAESLTKDAERDQTELKQSIEEIRAALKVGESDLKNGLRTKKRFTKEHRCEGYLKE